MRCDAGNIHDLIDPKLFALRTAPKIVMLSVAPKLRMADLTDLKSKDRPPDYLGPYAAVLPLAR